MKSNIQIDLIRKGNDAFPPFDDNLPNALEIPDALLEKFTPVLLIRHPVLQVDSIYRSMTSYSQCRPGDEDFNLITCTRHSRWLFEYFKHTRGGLTPIVVDGEDVLWRTQELGSNICAALGLPADGLKDQWDRLPEERKHPNWFLAAMTTTMTDSTGIERMDEKVSVYFALPDLSYLTMSCSSRMSQM